MVILNEFGYTYNMLLNKTNDNEQFEFDSTFPDIFFLTIWKSPAYLDKPGNVAVNMTVLVCYS